MSSDATLVDASAVLALLGQEDGADRLSDVVPGAFISAVNLAEVIHKLVDRGMPLSAVRATVSALHLTIVPFSAAEAYHSGDFIHPGVSLGDRACLGTAQMFGYRVITGDSQWVPIRRGVDVVVFRERRSGQRRRPSRG